MILTKTQLERYTTKKLIELQSDILEQIEELQERIDEGTHWMCNPANGCDLEDFLADYEEPAKEIESILNERIPANA